MGWQLAGRDGSQIRFEQYVLTMYPYHSTEQVRLQRMRVRFCGPTSVVLDVAVAVAVAVVVSCRTAVLEYELHFLLYVPPCDSLLCATRLDTTY